MCSAEQILCCQSSGALGMVLVVEVGSLQHSFFPLSAIIFNIFSYQLNFVSPLHSILEKNGKSVKM